MALDECREVYMNLEYSNRLKPSLEWEDHKSITKGLSHSSGTEHVPLIMGFISEDTP